jgi:hypothetical protein
VTIHEIWTKLTLEQVALIGLAVYGVVQAWKYYNREERDPRDE